MYVSISNSSTGPGNIEHTGTAHNAPWAKRCRLIRMSCASEELRASSDQQNSRIEEKVILSTDFVKIRYSCEKKTLSSSFSSVTTYIINDNLIGTVLCLIPKKKYLQFYFSSGRTPQCCMVLIIPRLHDLFFNTGAARLRRPFPRYQHPMSEVLYVT